MAKAKFLNVRCPIIKPVGNSVDWGKFNVLSSKVDDSVICTTLIISTGVGDYEKSVLTQPEESTNLLRLPCTRVNLRTEP